MAKAMQADQKLVENSQRVMLSDPLGGALTMSDIRSPTTHIVCKFYRRYLEELGLDPGFIEDFPTYNNLQHPEIHTFMLQHGLLAKTMNYFLTKVGSPLNFTITDLLTPTPARHRQILNELVNCLLFAGKIQHFAETAWENRKAREEKLQTLRDEVNHLKNHKAHQLHERGVREDKIKDFDKRMATTSEQFKRLTCELSEQRQRTNELHQELDENVKKHHQLTQSRDMHMNTLKQLEGQLVNSPMRFKQDATILEASLNSLTEDVTEREGILIQRQEMEKRLAEYIKVLRAVKEKATVMGDLKKKSTRNTNNVNELMAERQKLSAFTDKIKKDKSVADDRHQKLMQKSSLNNQTLDRKVTGILKNRQGMEIQEAHLTDLLDATDQAARTLSMDKQELDSTKQKAAEYEAAGIELMNLMHKSNQEEYTEFQNIIEQKFLQLKQDFESL